MNIIINKDIIETWCLSNNNIYILYTIYYIVKIFRFELNRTQKYVYFNIATGAVCLM